MDILNSARRGFALSGMAVGLAALLSGAGSVAESFDEYEVKAAFLVNFTKFVEWPAIASDGFAICILGFDPFGPSLDLLVKGKTAYNREIRIQRMKDPAEARQCQIVFVGRDEESKAAKLLDAVRGMPVLTVSERRSFIKMGGMISLFTEDARVQVGINVSTPNAAGLRMSAKLMRIAKDGGYEKENP